MIAKNIFTEEIIKDLDPSNENDLYYSLDKREWKFIEDFSKEAGFPTKPIAVMIIDGYEKPVDSLKDLINIQISMIGNFFSITHKMLALHLGII